MSSASSEPSTVRQCQSANTSVSSERSVRVPGIHYPTISIDSSPRSPSSSLKKQLGQYSVTALQFDHVKHRCRMMEAENQRLMRSQAEIVDDSNRRVDAHLNEIRMLKEENKKLAQNNKELRDLACFLDDDRQRARRMAREWHKFGRYTSHVMKQEISSYQQRTAEYERRCAQLSGENDELKHLCLYLDEQRQSLLACRTIDEESDDLGCGSSEQSDEAERPSSDNYNQQKEQTLKLISAQMQTSTASMEEEEPAPENKDSEKLIGYIQSLENRIRHLEMVQQAPESFWGSDTDEKTIIDRAKNDNFRGKMEQSTTSTMTSSCTTYGSTDTDGESAVYVMADDLECIARLELGNLGKIDEEKDADEETGYLPPPCAPLSASLLSVGRLSMTSDDFSVFGDGLARSYSASHSPALKSPAPIPAPRAQSVDRYSMPDTLQVIKPQERSDAPKGGSVAHQLYQMWSAKDAQRSDVSAV